MLSRYPNTVMQPEQALSEIWKKSDYFTARSMDVYIAKLRKRLAKDERIEIENNHSQGYIFHVLQSR
jgi:DNA-binding response OmpR family regulator